MTEPTNHNADGQRVFSDVRTAKTRAHANNEGYTVSLDRYAVPSDLENVHWLDAPANNEFVPTEMIARGVLLTTYHVTKDSDPTWHATIEIGAPNDASGKLRVVSATVAGDALTSTSLPLTPLVDACLRVGAVIGLYRDVVGEFSGRTTRTFRIGAPERDQDGRLFSADDIETLTGKPARKPRGYRSDPDVLRKVWEAVQRHSEITTHLTQREYVSKQCGLPISNIQKQITNARRMYGTNNKGDK